MNIGSNAGVFIVENKALNVKAGGSTYIAGVHELHLLDAGALAIFTEENNLLSAVVSQPNAVTVAADLKQVGQFRIAVGTGDANAPVRVSIPIDRKTFVYSKAEYTAPVSQVSYIGTINAAGSMNFPGTLVPGDIASVVINDVTSGTLEVGKRRQYDAVVATGSTAATILADLSAQINADANSVCTSAVTGANVGLTLTGKSGNVRFKVGVTGIIANANVYQFGANTSVNPFVGNGTNAQVQELFENGNATWGKHSKLVMPTQLFGYTQSLTGTWHIYTFQWSTEARAGQKVTQVGNPILYIAAKVGNASLTAIEAILDLLVDSSFSGAGGAPDTSSSGAGTTIADIPAGGKQ